MRKRIDKCILWSEKFCCNVPGVEIFGLWVATLPIGSHDKL